MVSTPYTFGRVVEDNIKNHFDSSTVQLPHHCLELCSCCAYLPSDHKSVHWHEESNGRVTPIIAELLSCLWVPVRVGCLVELKYRKKLDAIDAKPEQVRDLLKHAKEGASQPAAFPEFAVWVPCKAPHVHLIDHQIFQVQSRSVHTLPIKDFIRMHFRHNSHGGIATTTVIPSPDCTRLDFSCERIEDPRVGSTWHTIRV
mmetsp:Transcript_29986/g.75614  ORF Transcript_29986/g.75614 Transcript_29986/m.75614 type:complete len:200 (+) Transcript_29986:1416-2015(+)